MPAALSRRDFLIDYHSALDSLPPRQREVFELKQAGESHGAIAQLVGLSRRSVERLYGDAKAALREHLNGYEQFAE